jgi:PAS domain S-box-containing protein
LNYTLKDLLDICKLQELLDSQDEEHSLPSAIIDTDGNILTSTAWLDICTKFHRVNPDTQKKCIESDTHIRAEINKEMQQFVYRCPMGLIDAATPIIIDGKHLGNVFTGQFFMEPPDEEYFINQARQYGFDESKYLEALRKVPVLSENRLRSYLPFIAKLTQLLAEQGLQDLRQHEIEEALQKSEERFRSFVENADDIVFSLSKEGVFTYVSPNWKDAFGYELDETIGNSFIPFVHPDDVANCCSALIQVVSTGERRKNIEYRVLRKNGTLVWYSANGSLLHDAIYGEVSFLGIGRDISEQRKTEEALRSSESHYHSIFDTSLMGVAITDKDFNYIDVNEAFCKMLGYKKEELVGKTCLADITHPEDLNDGIEALNKLKNGETDYYIIKKRYIAKSGETITTMAYAKGKFSPDGEYEGAIGSVMDISGLLKAEEERLQLERQFLQAQKLESLGIMAGGIAHDFNNLLQSILGNMELAVVELAPGSEPQKLISSAMISAQQAANLSNLMLAYAGRGFINKKKLNLNLLVRKNADIFRSAASTAVSMELSLLAQLPPIIADEGQIQQVIMNLITNAAEAIEEQPGNIRVTTGVMDCDQTFLAASLLEQKPEPGRYVFLEVSDNGCGMSKDIINRLFDPFFTTKFTGRGLGMSAVMGIMKTYKGALLVESNLGKGTTFSVLFPASESALTAPDQEPVSSQPEISPVMDNPLSGLAMVVDDEKSVLRTCAKMVKLCGFTVITACDGIEAVTKFREHSDEIDVVLMDLTMPNMDGIAAMTEIRSIRPAIKVILASGFNESELSERISGQPPAGFIRKPYSMNEIETEFRRVMQENINHNDKDLEQE